MAANDTAMTRFLFAILEQKCLKDIDWNRVASNPILPDPITNGHAARMRFSRFKQTILGKDSKSRNRTRDNKNRVTKAKKEPKGKKSNQDENTVKDDAELPCPQEAITTAHSPRVKHELSQPPLPDLGVFTTTYPPTSAPMHASDMYSQLQSRLLTPCSDSDVVAACSDYGASQQSDMLHSDASFCNEHTHWAMNQAYPTFEAPYAFDSYSQNSAGHGHQLTGQNYDNHHHAHIHNGGLDAYQHTPVYKQEPLVPEARMEPDDDSQVVIKHEAWSSPC
ncbi:hypothetical protein DL546_006700 [Coniochaeta pulveracea]|uniref:Myb-like DNA-binding domain-containing protein n=1 Tax=Coniochaeta pulveracea TaxID=177199 RepID=A0A420YHY4_9PEZI|nr:hypothetical protein DL546_006700 [Coniochaeta pulveracea]